MARRRRPAEWGERLGSVRVEDSEVTGQADSSPREGPGSEPPAEGPSVTCVPRPGNNAREGLTHCMGRAMDQEPRGLGSDPRPITCAVCPHRSRRTRPETLSAHRGGAPLHTEARKRKLVQAQRHRHGQAQGLLRGPAARQPGSLNQPGSLSGTLNYGPPTLSLSRQRFREGQNKIILPRIYIYFLHCRFSTTSPTSSASGEINAQPRQRLRTLPAKVNTRKVSGSLSTIQRTPRAEHSRPRGSLASSLVKASDLLTHGAA